MFNISIQTDVNDRKFVEISFHKDYPWRTDVSAAIGRGWYASFTVPARVVHALARLGMHHEWDSYTGESWVSCRLFTLWSVEAYR